MPATNRAAALAYLAIALTGLAGCKGNGDDDPETTATVPAQGSADPRVVKRIPLKSTTEQVVAQLGRPARIDLVKAKGGAPAQTCYIYRVTGGVPADRIRLCFVDGELLSALTVTRKQ